MSKLIAATLEDHALAFALRADLVQMQREYLLDLEDVVVVTKDEKGKIKIHQALNLTAAGAVSGGWWGLLVGLLFLNPLVGAAVGAGVGAVSGKFVDIGVDDKFMKDVGESLENGRATVFILVRDVTQDKVIEGLQPYVGKLKLFTTSISRKDEEMLKEAFEAA
ncbi:MAG: DUF1269 domain-containing protein [Parvularculaceae bacterium]|nr:DUF1269 domain-containing protein [Parvularculaceae bacterium]